MFPEVFSLHGLISFSDEIQTDSVPRMRTKGSWKRSSFRSFPTFDCWIEMSEQMVADNHFIFLDPSAQRIRLAAVAGLNDSCTKFWKRGRGLYMGNGICRVRGGCQRGPSTLMMMMSITAMSAWPFSPPPVYNMCKAIRTRRRETNSLRFPALNRVYTIHWRWCQWRDTSSSGACGVAIWERPDFLEQWTRDLTPSSAESTTPSD